MRKKKRKKRKTTHKHWESLKVCLYQEKMTFLFWKEHRGAYI